MNGNNQYVFCIMHIRQIHEHEDLRQIIIVPSVKLLVALPFYFHSMRINKSKE